MLQGWHTIVASNLVATGVEEDTSLKRCQNNAVEKNTIEQIVLIQRTRYPLEGYASPSRFLGAPLRFGLTGICRTLAALLDLHEATIV
jgi:hypothetical protein